MQKYKTAFEPNLLQDLEKLYITDTKNFQNILNGIKNNNFDQKF